MSKNILLIKPRTFSSAKGMGIPLGLSYIASALKGAGHKVWIFDMQIDDMPLEYLLNKNLDMVGITCNTPERFEMARIAKQVKDYDDGIKVVVGGPHVTFTPYQTLKKIESIDFCVMFEGEKTILELCDDKPIKDIKGLAYRDGKEIVINQDREFIQDLDNLPNPARELLDMVKYDLTLPIHEHPLVTNIMTSRGCPFGCRFCAATRLSGLKIRYRSPENVLDEMEQIMSEYTFLEGLYIYDDHFTLNKKRAIEICHGIRERGLDIVWGCYGRVDSMDKELAKELYDGGCRMISYGVESGSQKVLDAMGKGTTPEKIIKAIRTTKDAGITTRASLLFGFPGEGLIDIYRTFAVLRKAGIKPFEMTRGYYPQLYPGTPLFAECRSSLPSNFDWYESMAYDNYKLIPEYVPPFDKLRMSWIKFLKGYNRLSWRFKGG